MTQPNQDWWQQYAEAINQLNRNATEGLNQLNRNATEGLNGLNRRFTSIANSFSPNYLSPDAMWRIAIAQWGMPYAPDPLQWQNSTSPYSPLNSPLPTPSPYSPLNSPLPTPSNTPSGPTRERPNMAEYAKAVREYRPDMSIEEITNLNRRVFGEEYANQYAKEYVARQEELKRLTRPLESNPWWLRNTWQNAATQGGVMPGAPDALEWQNAATRGGVMPGAPDALEWQNAATRGMVPPQIGAGRSGSLSPAWSPGYMRGSLAREIAPWSAGMPASTKLPTSPALANDRWFNIGNLWQYQPGGPNPFSALSGIDPNTDEFLRIQDAISTNLASVVPYAQMYQQQQQNDLQARQWQQDYERQMNQWAAQFGFNQAEANRQADQWAAQFGLSREQAARQAEQWQQQFGADAAARMWQQQYQQAESKRLADQWASEFGLSKEQAALKADQWSQEFQKQQSQWEKEMARQQAIDQWSQAFQTSQFDWQKQQAQENAALQREGQAMSAFGRKFGPNVAYF